MLNNKKYAVYPAQHVSIPVSFSGELWLTSSARARGVHVTRWGSICAIVSASSSVISDFYAGNSYRTPTTMFALVWSTVTHTVPIPIVPALFMGL